MVQNFTIEELADYVRALAKGDDRTILLIDGYTASGKTTASMALAQIPNVSWTPSYLFTDAGSLDVRKMKKDLIKPFRKEGKVREVVPAMSGSGIQRGRPQSGNNVLVIEGLGISKSARALKASVVCWIDCPPETLLARRCILNSQVPKGEHELAVQSETGSGLRAEALKTADFMIDSTASQAPHAGPTTGDLEAMKAASNAAISSKADADFARAIGMTPMPDSMAPKFDPQDPAVATNGTADVAHQNGDAAAASPAGSTEPDLLPGWLADD